MISYDEALSIILETVAPSKEDQEVSVVEGLARVLSKDAKSTVANPPFRASAMDGYALCSGNTVTASEDTPLTLSVSKTIAAGDPPPSFDEAEDNSVTKYPAVEVMTGAVVPDHLDAVVRIEHVTTVKDESGSIDSIVLERPVPIGANIREKAEDFDCDQSLIRSGTVLLPHHMMTCHCAGIGRVSVKKRVRVGVITTGAELVDCLPDNSNSLLPGQIFNSCSTFLTTAIPLLGTECSYYGTVADEPETFLQVLKTMLADNLDIIVSTGAVSEGRYDFVPDMVQKLGAEVLFHKAAIRPGKPLLFAKLEEEKKRTVFFCLPGNPVASITGLRFFLEPYLRAVFGRDKEEYFTATLSSRVKKPEGLTKFCLGKLASSSKGVSFSPHEKQLSFMLSPVVRTDAWALLPEGKESFEAGEEVLCASFYPNLD